MSCPSCQAEITTDAFGLIACPKCGAQIIIGMEGDADKATDFASAQAPIVADPIVAEAITEPLEEPPVAVPSPGNVGNLADIADYGNSPVSQAREGMLRVHICLTNIDTSDVRKAVREVLEDPRFLFDVDSILHAIRDGEVKISDVTPVKAAVLIQRLRALPVGITWEQYAIHSS